MAKKKRKDEPEEPKYEWVPPTFDEKGFLQKDIQGTKALVISSILAFIIGVVAYAVTGISFYLGLIIIFVSMLALRFIFPLFKLNVAEIEKKTMAGNYALLFLLALGIWIILLNPPFSDQQAPEIQGQSIWFQHGGTGKWTPYTSAGSTPIWTGDPTNITVEVRDNGRIASVQIEVHISGQPAGTYVDMQSTGEYGVYRYVSNYSTAGQYIYSVRVLDGANHLTTTSGTFSVINAP